MKLPSGIRKPTHQWTVWLALLLAMVMAAYLTWREAENIRQRDAQTFVLRARLISDYVQACERIVDAMASTVSKAYLNTETGTGNHPALQYLRDYPEHEVFGISGLVQDGGTSALSGTLTGAGSKQHISADVQREIIAALALDGQIGVQTGRKSDFVWAYYTSARGFVYLAPRVSVNDFRFTADLYKKEFWTHAIASANPGLMTVITPLYEDQGGKGLMISASAPVVVNHVLLGVASVDIGIETLHTLLTVGQSVGDSILIDNNLTIVAKAGKTIPGTRFHLNPKQLGHQPVLVGGQWWAAQTLADGEITILHRLDISKVYLAALLETSHLWLLLLLLASLFFLLLRLRQALSRVTELAHMDSLSSLLNRRGFRSDIARILALNNRVNAPWVVLLLDIDHFKRINDRFGHDIGDQTIMAIARVLQRSVRESDRAGRWGGEEFVIFLYNTDLGGALRLAEKYRTEIAAAVASPDHQPVTVSIGVAEAHADSGLDTVLDVADRRLYRAKNAGRNRVCAEG